MAERQLIVTADDLGQSHGINRGIAEAHERGIVTSASLMVRGPAAPDAAAYARAHPALSVGLHVDLGEWRCHEGAWTPVYTIVPGRDPAAVETEVAWQLERFVELVGRPPSHLDSHQHAHRREPARSALGRLAHGLGIPLRGSDARIRHCGDFYGQTTDGQPWPEGVTVAALVRILQRLPPGCTELACHPGYADDVDTMYRAERAREVQVLCDPRVRAALRHLGIRLTSFAAAAVPVP